MTHQQLIENWLKKHNLEKSNSARSIRGIPFYINEDECSTEFYMKNLTDYIGSKVCIDQNKEDKLIKFLKLADELFS